MNIFLLTVFSYLIGSIPTAYLLSKWQYGRDIRNSGSGNVGTLNFFRTSRAVAPTVVVLVVDLGKGFLAVYLSGNFLSGLLLIFPAIGVLLGHIYPIWLRFKGGRGLATLGGIFLYFQPLAVLIWIFAMIAGYLFTKNLYIATLFAIFIANVMIAIFWSLPVFIISSATSLLVGMQYIPVLTKSETKR